MLRSATNDTLLISVNNHLSEKLWRKGSYTEAIQFAEEALERSKKVNGVFFKGMGKAQRNLGMSLFYLGNYAKSLEHLFACLQTYETINDKSGVATASESIGIVYRNEGNLQEALKFHKTALNMRILLKNKNGMATSYNNIGIIYFNLGNLEGALTNYVQSLKLKEANGNRQGMGNSYHNISGVYSARGDSAIKAGNKIIAEKYFDSALQFCFKSLEIDKENENLQGEALVMNSIGLIYLHKNVLKEAEKYFSRSLQLSNKIGSLNDAKDAEESLSEVYSRLNNHKEAFSHYKTFVMLRDSIHNEETAKKTTRVQMQYEFDKRSAADSIRNAESKKVEELKHQQEISKQRAYTFGGITGVLVMIVVSAISFRAFKNKQKANVEIENQKRLVEEKQKEILDSIRYAKRIQTALLTGERYIGRKLESLKQIRS